jgi:D-glycero-alpha-D-manno-heptose-7-phosphate kinase
MIITQTPLRIGLLGGGTDLPDYYREHGGRVLNCAIDKYIYVIVKQRFDDEIYVNYSKKEIVSRVEDLEHELVREAMWMTGVTSGVEITTLADIPSAGGSGLGSSSAVTVGLLHALFAYRGRQVTAGPPGPATAHHALLHRAHQERQLDLGRTDSQHQNHP